MMNRLSRVGRLAARFGWHLLSIPVFCKILGIGVLVAAVFGTVTLLQIRGSISQGLHQMLEQRTWSMAQSLVASLERPMSTGDLFTVNQKLHRTMSMFPDVRYIIVRNAAGRIVAHTFERAVPTDLARAFPQSADAQEHFGVLASGEGLVFNVLCPILNGRAGTLQLGATDQMITRELSNATRSVLWSLALCATIGAGLALLLTHILARPIHNLVQAANRIRGGDFETRSEVSSADEIGRLAVAFNQMAESLQRYRREVQEKDRTRLSLIERIVQAQEDERKSISRELHDQLGQSLSALLLVVQAHCRDHQPSAAVDHEIENRIRQLIDEVGQLAWGMRPSILDDYGLDFALARLVEEMANHFGLVIDYQYSSPPGLGRLPSRIEVSLYRIAQEAITNIVRHAHASQASAVLLQRRDEITLLVEDNGCGFDTASAQKASDGCLGLTGMKERATLLGGTWAVESLPGQGTTVRVRIPLNEAQECLSVS